MAAPFFFARLARPSKRGWELNSPYLRHNLLVPGQMWHYLGSGTGDKASFGRGDR